MTHESAQPAVSTSSQLSYQAALSLPLMIRSYHGENRIGSTQQTNNLKDYMLHLRSFIQPKSILQSNGYIVQKLSEEELERKKRCLFCGKCISKNKVDKKVKGVGGKKQLSGEEGLGLESNFDNCTGSPQLQQQSNVNFHLDSTKTPARQPIFRCKFHDGKVLLKTWSCCRNHVSSEPCTGHESHIPIDYSPGSLEHLWQFYETPQVHTSSDTHAAVAIDCEMGTAKSGDCELIRVTVIDYFSSEVLIDSLVWPDVEMSHYNTEFSGVTMGQMQKARRKGQCFMGRDLARMAVWKFVGPETVVVGHSVNNDLTALRWIHLAVVDTHLIDFIKVQREKAEAEQDKLSKHEKGAETEALETVPQIENPNREQPAPKKLKGSGNLSLKTLASVRLGRQIQTNGKQGHDSLEDAIASRDLAHWHVAARYHSLAAEE